jgi:hypothetical protein
MRLRLKAIADRGDGILIAFQATQQHFYKKNTKGDAPIKVSFG